MKNKERLENLTPQVWDSGKDTEETGKVN